VGDDIRSLTDSIYDGLDRFIDGAGRLIGVDTGPSPGSVPLSARVVTPVNVGGPALPGREQLALPAVAGEAAPSHALAVAVRKTGIPAFTISEDRRRGTFMVGNGVEVTECPTRDFAIAVRDQLNKAIGAVS
jgi:hypothetical protein